MRKLGNAEPIVFVEGDECGTSREGSSAVHGFFPDFPRPLLAKRGSTSPCIPSP